jgi:hypothetical protein
MIKMASIDFLIIGAAKSATTWLQRNLQSDPGVYMPDPELHYFSRHYERGDDWYLSQFDCDDDSRIIGEKSNSYLDDLEAPQRIRNTLPDAKLVAQLRNPVERAYSDYCMLYRRGDVGRNIEDHLDPRRAADERFIANGRYREQIDRFLDLFPRDRFLFLLFEDVAARPQRQLSLIRGFLGLPEHTEQVPKREKVKDKTTKVMPPVLKRYLKPLKPLSSRLRKTHGFDTVATLLQREIEYPALSDDLRERLTDYYAPEIEVLQDLLGEDLSAWRAPASPL